MRRHTNPTLTRCGEDAVPLQLADDQVAFDRWMAKADNARAGSWLPRNHELITAGAHAILNLLGQGVYRRGDVLDAYFEQEFQGCAVAIAPNRVQGATLIASGIGAEVHMTSAVIEIIGRIGPAEFNWLYRIQPFAPDI